MSYKTMFDGPPTCKCLRYRLSHWGGCAVDAGWFHSRDLCRPATHREMGLLEPEDRGES